MEVPIRSSPSLEYPNTKMTLSVAGRWFNLDWFQTRFGFHSKYPLDGRKTSIVCLYFGHFRRTGKGSSFDVAHNQLMMFEVQINVSKLSDSFRGIKRWSINSFFAAALVFHDWGFCPLAFNFAIIYVFRPLPPITVRALFALVFFFSYLTQKPFPFSLMFRKIGDVLSQVPAIKKAT